MGKAKFVQKDKSENRLKVSRSVLMRSSDFMFKLAKENFIPVFLLRTMKGARTCPPLQTSLLCCSLLPPKTYQKINFEKYIKFVFSENVRVSHDAS